MANSPSNDLGDRHERPVWGFDRPVSGDWLFWVGLVAGLGVAVTRVVLGTTADAAPLVQILDPPLIVLSTLTGVGVLIGSIRAFVRGLRRDDA